MTPGTSIALVVDDNSDVLESIRNVLATEGWACWLAPSADDALLRLQREPVTPDVILLDLWMPGMPADAFFSSVRNGGPWSNVPVVLVTAAGPQQIPKALRPDATLHKPFRLEELTTAIRSAQARRSVV
jgi:CheY-like chemotaxis protein